MARNTDTVGEATKTRKTPRRRAMAHLPATCQSAIEVLNDMAWEFMDTNGATENSVDRMVGHARKARQILRDGLAVVEPKSE